MIKYLIMMGLMVSGKVHAQYSKQQFSSSELITLKGFLGVQGGEAYTYKLEFTDSAGYIKGHSFTYLYETKEVKATIEGKIDRQERTLRFKEKEIVHNTGFESGTTICLINAVLRYKQDDNGKEIYTGAITSADAGNVYCGQGTVTFPYNEALKTVLAAKPSAIEMEKNNVTAKPAKPMRVIYDTTVRRPAGAPGKAKNEPEKITAGIEKYIEWYSDTLLIELWDGGHVDGDKITVEYNGKVLANNYTLGKEHKQFISFPVEGLKEIVFIANHEGNQPPMTANIWLIDGTKKHELIVYNKIGRAARIKIRKVIK